MPRPPNRELPDLLLTAAIELIDERADVTFSMRELAARIGYSVTAVYRCYETRGHLLRVVALRLFDGMVKELSRPETGPPADTLAEVGAQVVSWALANPGRYRVMFQHDEADARLTPDEQETARAGLRYLESLLSRSGAAHARDKATVAWALVHGVASLAIAGRLEIPNDHVPAFFRAMVAPVLRALASS